MKTLASLILLVGIVGSCKAPKKTQSPSNSRMLQPDLSKITYEGGDGKTAENAIIIKHAKNEFDGVAAEYAYISKIHGEMNKYWKLIEQATGSHKGRQLDIMNTESIPQGEKLVYYFDINDFYGKF